MPILALFLAYLFPLPSYGLNFLVPYWFSLHMFDKSFISHLIPYLERSYAHALIYSVLHTSVLHTSVCSLDVSSGLCTVCSYLLPLWAGAGQGVFLDYSQDGLSVCEVLEEGEEMRRLSLTT